MQLISFVVLVPFLLGSTSLYAMDSDLPQDACPIRMQKSLLQPVDSATLKRARNTSKRSEDSSELLKCLRRGVRESHEESRNRLYLYLTVENYDKAIRVPFNNDTQKEANEVLLKGLAFQDGWAINVFKKNAEDFLEDLGKTKRKNRISAVKLFTNKWEEFPHPQPFIEVLFEGNRKSQGDKGFRKLFKPIEQMLLQESIAFMQRHDNLGIQAEEAEKLYRIANNLNNPKNPYLFIAAMLGHTDAIVECFRRNIIQDKFDSEPVKVCEFYLKAAQGGSLEVLSPLVIFISNNSSNLPKRLRRTVFNVLEERLMRTEYSNPITWFNFALLKARGTGCEPDLEKACVFYLKALEGGPPEALGELAACLGNHSSELPGALRTKVFNALEGRFTLEECSDSKAIYNFAVLNERGIGCEPDLEKACVFYLKALEGDFPEALGDLAACLGNHSSELSETLRMKVVNGLEERITAKGFSDARVLYNFAMLIEEGIGCEPDPEKACELYLKAVQGKCQEALSHLVIFMIHNSSELPGALRTKVFNVLEGRLTLEGCSDSKAMYNFAVLNARGIGCEPDPEKACAFYLKALEGGSVEALGDLGACLGRHSSELPGALRTKVFNVLEERITLEGCSDAMALYNFAVLNKRGVGCEPDPEKACAFYLKATQVGSPEALIYLPACLGNHYSELSETLRTKVFNVLEERITLEGCSDASALYNFAILLQQGFLERPANPQKARDFFERAAEANFAPSMVLLSLSYLDDPRDGDSLENKKLALYWMHKAKSLGNTLAARYLGLAEKYSEENYQVEEGDEESVNIEECEALEKEAFTPISSLEWIQSSAANPEDKTSEEELSDEGDGESDYSESNELEIDFEETMNEEGIAEGKQEEAPQVTPGQIESKEEKYDMKTQKYWRAIKKRQRMSALHELNRKTQEEHLPSKTLLKDVQKIIDKFFKKNTGGVRLSGNEIERLCNSPFFEGQLLFVPKTKKGFYVRSLRRNPEAHSEADAYPEASAHRQHKKSKGKHPFIRDMRVILSVFGITGEE